MSITALFGIVLPCILSLLLWTIYLYGTNEMTVIRLIAVLMAGFCPVVNACSLVIVITFLCYSVYMDDVDYGTKSGRIIRFFTKKR